ncbi:MAG: citrate/2-methylcitrate synthase, partial [Clostridia bacterium]
MAETAFKAGLEDVVAGTSDICFIDGKEGRLVYRGYNVNDLWEHSSFEEIAYLLWHSKLPSKGELEALERELAQNRELPAPVMELLRSLPKDTHPMDVVRTSVSLLGIYDRKDAAAMTPEANRAIAA